jgi:two-component system, sensor histidine kinase and response regulator
MGHLVVLATNGLEAVELALREEFDIVLMDISMPVMDGTEACAKIRAAGKSELPIVALTAHAMLGDRERFLACGMNECLAKPFDVQQLAKLLDLYFPVANGVPDAATVI